MTMDVSTFCRRMRQDVTEHSVGREESAAFLVWYLENYFRLESDDAIGSVCDHTNDKGIDGIYVDDEDETIYLFQSKYSPNDDQEQGDRDIRNLIGAREWFRNEESVNNLLTSTASAELKAKVQADKIVEKTHYEKRSIFVTNKRFNRHAQEYIEVTENLEACDSQHLFNKYSYFADEDIVLPAVDLSIHNSTRIEYDLPNGPQARVFAIRAKELLKLEGIQDRTLFYKNVRYGIGKTRVNKDIKNTIGSSDEHKNFFFYHNGISIICREFEENPAQNTITLTGYAVVNGCQSMLSFYENREELSNNLLVLVKIIRINPTSTLISRITHNANNQNSISLRDLRADDSVQRSLQREFRELFNNRVFYNRKRGEPLVGFDCVIDKDFAAQIISAVYLGEPHQTHLKQKLFGENYPKVFSRTINAERVYLAYQIHQIVENNAELLANTRIRNYGLALFFFSHVLSEILKQDHVGARILENPRSYVTESPSVFVAALTQVWRLITPDINIDLEEYTEDNQDFFDYKNVFKNATFVRDMRRNIISDYERIIRRNSSDSFSSIYNEMLHQDS